MNNTGMSDLHGLLVSVLFFSSFPVLHNINYPCTMQQMICGHSWNLPSSTLYMWPPPQCQTYVKTYQISNNNQGRIIPEIPEALLILSPCAVKADRAIEPLLYHSPATSKGLHVTKNLKCPIAGYRCDIIDTVLLHLQHIVVWTVPRG